MLNIVMVNANNYLGRGEDYVARLKIGVTRNLTVPHVFRVLTEEDSHSGVSGWWHKIEMFRPGRFDGRCLFFDLDTIITGSLDDIAAYDGDFAMLSDFFHPDLAASGVMAWDARKAHSIWTMWQNAGRPQFHPRGDQGWIAGVMPNADRLQTRYPGQLVSFKADCGAGVPDGARVVAFHGLPRPHHIHDLMRHW